MKAYKTIGNNIRTLRKNSGYSQEILAKYLGISRPELSYYENGTRNIPIEIVEKVAELYAIDEYDLYENDDVLNKINLSMAFRADEGEVENLETIAKFKKIATNYLKMKRALENEIK